MTRRQNGLGARLAAFSSWATVVTGSTQGFSLAALMIIVWLITGPAFGFSDTWQLVMNTVTSIITFLMVFLIQRSQNKESLAVQLKLNELVAAVQGASNRLIDVEDLSEHELQVLHQYYQRLVIMAKKDEKLGESHSVEEAQVRHTRKRAAPSPPPAGVPGDK
jgi:low affinity Fe/Cu permease